MSTQLYHKKFIKKKKYNKYFKKEMSQNDIVTFIINTDKKLYNDYQIYQGITKSINSMDKTLFLNIFNSFDMNNSMVLLKELIM